LYVFDDPGTEERKECEIDEQCLEGRGIRRGRME
jgi:hypothetical protein